MHNALLRFVLPLLFLLLQIRAAGQQSKQYAFKRFTVSNGLAANFVIRTVQDKEGYMWLATSNGLQRYDGNTFITFRNKKGDPTTIPRF